MSQQPPRITLYERAGCHMCEEAAYVLDAAIGPDRYERVDIDASDELVLRYGFRVPVLAIDGVDRLDAPMTAEEVTALAASLG
jgi:glutaredoxin